MKYEQHDTRMIGLIFKITLIIMSILLLCSAALVFIGNGEQEKLLEWSAQIYAALIPMAILCFAIFALVRKHSRLGLPALAIFTIWIVLKVVSL